MKMEGINFRYREQLMQKEWEEVWCDGMSERRSRYTVAVKEERRDLNGRPGPVDKGLLRQA